MVAFFLRIHRSARSSPSRNASALFFWRLGWLSRAFRFPPEVRLMVFLVFAVRGMRGGPHAGAYSRRDANTQGNESVSHRHVFGYGVDVGFVWELSSALQHFVVEAAGSERWVSLNLRVVCIVGGGISCLN